MPRQQITHEPITTGDTDTVPAGGAHAGLAQMFVSWVRDGHVQVGFEVSTAYLKLALETPNGRDSDHTEIFTDTLTRREINEAIRVLRRARDAADGADE